MARLVSKANSIKVTVPDGVAVEKGSFVALGGVVGLALQSVDVGATDRDIVLDITQGIYETSQINSNATFTVGSKLFWDNTAKVFTTTETNTLVGVITEVIGAQATTAIQFLYVPAIVGNYYIAPAG